MKAQLVRAPHSLSQFDPAELEEVKNMGERARILVVDDDENMLKTIREHLKKQQEAKNYLLTPYRFTHTFNVQKAHKK